MSALVAFLKALAALFGFGKAAVIVGGGGVAVAAAVVAGEKIQKDRDNQATLDEVQETRADAARNDALSDDELRKRLLAGGKP